MIALSQIFFLIGIISSIETVVPGPKLIIDEDGGADDAMAIFTALLYEKYFDGPKVVALTTVSGNVHEPQVFNNTQRILDIARRRDVPIFRGSKSALVIEHKLDYYFGHDGLGDNETVKYKPIPARTEHAAIALIELSKKYEGELSILCIGSLTNIALAIKLDSEFINRLSQLYVAAGNIYSEKHPDLEFNAYRDVEAYRIVAKHGKSKKLTLIPFSQIMDDVEISKEWRINVLGSIPTEIMRAQNVFEQISIKKSKSWIPLDPVAMTVVLNYSSIVEEIRYSNNSIYLCGKNRGINTNIIGSMQEANTKLVYSMNGDRFKQFLLNVFSAELK